MRSLSESKLKKLSNTSMFILVRTLSLHDPNSNYLGSEQVRNRQSIVRIELKSELIVISEFSDKLIINGLVNRSSWGFQMLNAPSL